MNIIPAIIPKNFEELEEKMASVSKLVPLVQLDVLDGSLVSLRSWPYQSPSKRDAFFDAIIREEQGFPLWQEVEFEAHLMVNNPERMISDWVSAGASRIIVEIEGVKNFPACVKSVAGRVPFGVSLALDTPNDILIPIAKDISVIQCMGWNFKMLGHQGRTLDDAVYEKIRELRKLYPEHIISVDGGVTFENAPKLISAGANALVVGSAIFDSPNPKVAIESFQHLT